jgi:glucose-6-phosphate-specific signal transduction histidine kinase
MTKSVNLLYAVAWLLYIVFSVLMFPILGISTGIPIFLLTGIGAWLYGLTKGLSIVAFAAVYHTILYSFVYSEYFETYQTKFSSPLILLGITYLIAYLKITSENIKQTTHRLDQLVQERNSELARLTEKLLEHYESIKIKQAQLLHDGIGQQLTGIQLISSSLADQLLQEKNPAVSTAHHLRNQTGKLHNHVRKISRLLFPVRMEQVGLISAIDELSSCLQDVKSVESVTSETVKFPEMPASLILQIYRICQESTLFSIDRLNADQIHLELSATDANIMISITHNGCPPDTTVKNGSFNLIQFRLRLLQGQMKVLTRTTNSRTAQFIIPIPSKPLHK